MSEFGCIYECVCVYVCVVCVCVCVRARGFVMLGSVCARVRVCVSDCVCDCVCLCECARATRHASACDYV